MIRKTMLLMCDRCKGNKLLNIDECGNVDYKTYFHHITDNNDDTGYKDYDLCNACYEKFNKFIKGEL